MSDTNAIIDAWRGAKYWASKRWHGTLDPGAVKAIRQPPDGPEPIGRVLISLDEAMRCGCFHGDGIPSYTTDARLIQPMLDRCIEVGWQVDFGYYTIKQRCSPFQVGNLVHAIVWSTPDIITSGHEKTLSEALTQAIVAMIETSQATTCRHCDKEAIVNNFDLCDECSQALSDFSEKQSE